MSFIYLKKMDFVFLFKLLYRILCYVRGFVKTARIV